MVIRGLRRLIMNGGCGCGRRGAGVPGCRGVGAVAVAGTGGCGCGCECGFGFGSSGAAGGCGCGCRPSCAGAFDDLVSGTGDRTVAAGYAEALAGLYARSGVRLASRQTPIRSWRFIYCRTVGKQSFRNAVFQPFVASAQTDVHKQNVRGEGSDVSSCAARPGAL